MIERERERKGDKRSVFRGVYLRSIYFYYFHCKESIVKP